MELIYLFQRIDFSVRQFLDPLKHRHFKVRPLLLIKFGRLHPIPLDQGRLPLHTHFLRPLLTHVKMRQYIHNFLILILIEVGVGLICGEQDLFLDHIVECVKLAGLVLHTLLSQDVAACDRRCVENVHEEVLFEDFE